MKSKFYLKKRAFRSTFRGLLVVLLTCLAGEVLAQPDYYYVNTSSAISNTIPLKGTTNKRQWLFEPADFSAAMPPGNITKLYVRVSESAASTFGTFEVKIGTTALTALVSGPWVAGLTTVYNGTNVNFTPQTYGTPTGNWIEIPLQTNFSWNGSSNLVVEVSQTGYSPGFSVVQSNIANTSLYGTTSAATGTTQARHGQVGFDYMVCDSPQNLTATAITPYSATVSWDTTFGPNNYEYLVTTDPNPPGAPLPTTFNSHNIGGLTPNTWYYIHVRAECPAGSPNQWSGWALDSFKTRKPCDTPTNITVTNISDNNAIVKWNGAQYAVHYEFAFSTSPLAPTFGAKIFDTTVFAPGLKGGRNYYVHLRSVCDDYPYSGWVAKPFYVLAPVSASSVNADNFAIDAYPNPVKNELQVTVSGKVNGSATINIADAMGKTVRTVQVQNAKANVDMSGLAAGMYIVQYTDDVRRETIKINKQ